MRQSIGNSCFGGPAWESAEVGEETSAAGTWGAWEQGITPIDAELYF